jgi:hypothetical protein
VSSACEPRDQRGSKKAAQGETEAWVSGTTRSTLDELPGAASPGARVERGAFAPRSGSAGRRNAALAYRPRTTRGAIQAAARCRGPTPRFSCDRNGLLRTLLSANAPLSTLMMERPDAGAIALSTFRVASSREQRLPSETIRSVVATGALLVSSGKSLRRSGRHDRLTAPLDLRSGLP